jgi:hypothetical protein
VIFLLASTIAAAAGRSFGASVWTAVWTALFGTSLVFAIRMAEALRWYRIDGRLLPDGEVGSFFVGVNIRDAIFWILMFVPAWGLPSG